MIVTAGNHIALDTPDAWNLALRLEGYDLAIARRLMRRLLRRISRTPLYRSIELDIDQDELELVLAAICDTHTQA